MFDLLSQRPGAHCARALAQSRCHAPHKSLHSCGASDHVNRAAPSLGPIGNIKGKRVFVCFGSLLELFGFTGSEAPSWGRFYNFKYCFCRSVRLDQLGSKGIPWGSIEIYVFRSYPAKLASPESKLVPGGLEGGAPQIKCVWALNPY